MTVLDLVKEIYAFLKRPSEQELAQTDLLAIISRKVNDLLILAQVSDRNYLALLSNPLTFNGSDRTMSVSIDELSSIVRVESRTAGDTNEENWSEEIISDYGSWNDVTDSRVDAVAFYGNPADGLTMAVNRDATNLEFRIMYEVGGISLSNLNEALPMVQTLFKSAIFYPACAEAAMMLGGLNPEGEKSRNQTVVYLLAQASDALTKYEKWLLNSPGQAVAYRESFASNRLGHGQVRMFAHDQFGGYYETGKYN